MSDPDVISVAEAWPEHAEHKVRYSEHGRTDYIVKTIRLVHLSATERAFDVEDYDNRPESGDIEMTEFWCATCGVILPSFEEDG